MAGATPKTPWLSLDWPVDEIRETFFSYLGENQYAKLSSTPVIPIDDPKVPLIHTCLNRFKGALNGTGSHRTCFSLRCIVTSSDDDVIEHFRSDTTYHRFTEILGSWSSGDYFKEEAIGLLLSLLSKKCGLPESRIHATYFGGGISSGLSPDNESKTALQKCTGEERILPSMSKEDFWMSGETGPCGPSVGIFFDGSNSQDGVNGKFIEISRTVFVEFNRQADGVLSPLQAKHIITGINLQCLAAILQKKESLYELDDYDTIIDCISSRAGEEIDSYSGKVGEADTDGVDTAYRLLADHMKMISATNAPGSQLGPGHEGREYFLKCADKLAVQYGHKVLKILNQDRYALIVFVSLFDSDLCPELEGYRKKDQIEKDEVMIYLKTIVELRDQNLPFDMVEKKKKKKGATSVVWYATRVIEFLGRRTPIVLKNKNTRCSLVALCNVLLLGEKITLNLDIKKVSEGHLIYLVQSYLLYGNTQMQLEQNLELSEFNKQVLGVLPKLPGSLYFDVKFASSCGFEQTLETALFGCLGVPLHHGWMVDRQDVELGSSIHRSSYFRLSITLAMYESLLPKPQKYDVGCEDDMFYSALAFSSTEPEELTSCARISTFLRGPQLTPYGFSSLKNDLEERQPSLLLWNETLLTVSKVEDQIYVLLNDISLLSTHTDAVWERLREGNDDGYFVDCNFMPTNSLIQSILPLTKNERKMWKKKAEMGLKGPLLPKEKEEDRNDDRKEDRNEDRDYEKNEEEDDEKNEEKDDEKTEEKDDEKTKEKDDGKAEEKDENIQEKAIISGMRGNLNMRPIDFFGRSTHIIHQINDGPCALIAVCNILLLKGDIFFERHETVVPMDYLLNLVFTLIRESAKMQAYSPEIQRQIWDVAPKLAEGFDVNVVFNRTDGFTVTPEWLLLDCLDLNVRHGWIPNVDLLPGPEVSFERLTLESLEPDCPNAETIKNFLNGHQLTLIGLVSLLEDLVENVPCILYCHYHYSTIVKVNGVVYSLVTNINYLRTRAVWQMLEVNGGGVYLDSNFRPIYMWLDAAPSGSFSVPETSTSEASTSFMKPDSEGITSHGDRLGLDSFTQLHSGPDTAPLRDNLHGSRFVPKTRTRRSCTNSMRPYTDEDMSNEKSVPGPQTVPGTRKLPLKEFVLIPGNEFSKSRTIFAGGTSLNVADTTRTGRVLGLDVLEDLVFSHVVGLSWNGKFDLSTIYVVDGVRAEICAPYCEKFCEKAKFNDYFSYICNIVELFKIEGVGLPAFFTQLVRLLSDPPHRPSGCNLAQLEGYRRRLHGFWDCVLTTLALRSSSARGRLFNGIQRIRHSAPLRVRSRLKEILANARLEGDWREPIAKTGHPVLKKVLGYIPGDGSDEEAKEKEPEDRKFGLFTPDSNEEAKEKEPEDRNFGLFTPDADSLSVFPRQVNEHAKSKEDLELEWRHGVVKEPFNKLSELELLTSHYLEDKLPVILGALLCSDHLMTHELWEWLKEVLEEYARPEVLGRETWNSRHRNHARGTWGNLRRRARRVRGGGHAHGARHGRGGGRGRAGHL